jgi:hypothetical protein
MAAVRKGEVRTQRQLHELMQGFKITADERKVVFDAVGHALPDEE